MDQNGQLWKRSQWIPGADVIFAVGVGVTCIGFGAKITASGTSFGTHVCLYLLCEDCNDGLICNGDTSSCPTDRWLSFLLPNHQIGKQGPDTSE